MTNLADGGGDFNQQAILDSYADENQRLSNRIEELETHLKTADGGGGEPVACCRAQGPDSKCFCLPHRRKALWLASTITNHAPGTSYKDENANNVRLIVQMLIDEIAISTAPTTISREALGRDLSETDVAGLLADVLFSENFNEMSIKRDEYGPSWCQADMIEAAREIKSAGYTITKHPLPLVTTLSREASGWKWLPVDHRPLKTGTYLVGHRGHQEIMKFFGPDVPRTQMGWMRIGKHGWERDDPAERFNATHCVLIESPPNDVPSSSLVKWKHKKRGSTVTEVARGFAQVSIHPIEEMSAVVIYYHEEGDRKLWYVRNAVEFDDGRFEETT